MNDSNGSKIIYNLLKYFLQINYLNIIYIIIIYYVNLKYKIYTSKLIST